MCLRSKDERMSIDCDFKKRVHKQKQREAKYNAKIRREKNEFIKKVQS